MGAVLYTISCSPLVLVSYNPVFFLQYLQVSRCLGFAVSAPTITLESCKFTDFGNLLSVAMMSGECLRQVHIFFNISLFLLLYEELIYENIYVEQ